MDPNEALEQARQLAAGILDEWPEGDDQVTPAISLAEAFQGLDEWLSRGGFKPAAWQ
jgi:hypothetical protein